MSQKKRLRRTSLLVVVMLIAIGIIIAANVVYMIYRSPEAQLNREAEVLWQATPPPEPPTFAILSKIGDQSPEGGRLLYGGVAGIWNRSNHDIVINLEFLQSAAILNSGCPMTIEISDDLNGLLWIAGGTYQIGTKNNESLNAGLLAACYASRFSPPENQITPAEGLGIYEFSMLTRMPYAEYKALMSDRNNPYIVTYHYKWMLKSMYDVGLTGLPLRIVTP